MFLRLTAGWDYLDSYLLRISQEPPSLEVFIIENLKVSMFSYIQLLPSDLEVKTER